MVHSDLSSHCEKTPMRTCIGCRRCCPSADLVRLVVRPGGSSQTVVIDHERTMSGRGAWLHPAPECLGVAAARKAFARAFRVGGLTVDTDLLTREIESVATERGRQQSATKEQVAEDMSTP